jgi:hypothetical protein
LEMATPPLKVPLGVTTTQFRMLRSADTMNQE